jgi:hypothetical protein
MKTLAIVLLLTPLWAQGPPKAAEASSSEAAPAVPNQSKPAANAEPGGTAQTAPAPAPQTTLASQTGPAPVSAPAPQTDAPANQTGAPAAQTGAPAAQTSAPAAQPSAPTTENPAPAAQESTPAAQTTSAPAAQKPSSDNWFQGSIQFGYRWIPNINGSDATYRSVINLGQGPKLLDANVTILNPSKRFFDRADIQTSSWGDPYNTLRADVQKDGVYRLTVDYRTRLSGKEFC